MVFRKLKAKLGVGVTVDTVLHDANVTPGGPLRGEVRFTGGEVDYQVQNIAVELNAVVEVERGDEEYKTTYDFYRAQVSGAFILEAGASKAVPFQVTMPWETPMTSFNGYRLPGMKLGVATELALEGAMDKGDLDPLVVEPLPVQRNFVQAVKKLGFKFHKADLEAGSLRGSNMPFYQELEYRNTGEFRGAFKSLELTFISSQNSTQAIMEVDKPGGILSSGGDQAASLTIDNNDGSDLTERVRSQLQQLAKRRGLFDF